ncbi:ABC transporter ATP-binding protein [uncultured Roseibium sp.]|uniref:energy-coupling factor ABC transporter ATP-binding protein n=1 Tax=uncultured Roseibium sp. TaxID=1936171 RepID=UPI002591DD23|nr:ABC transporter ATP-binding protein [uncultured Roseibium sp.]
MAFWTRKNKDTKSKEAVIDADFDAADKPYAVLQNVSLELEGRTVLQDISLSLQEARVGIVGLNGSGKSSLVRLLNGLRMPTGGEVRMFGVSTEAWREELPRYVGFVFQNPDHQAIFPTVEEEIAFGLTQLGVARAEARTQALAFLDRHHCGPLAEKPFADLSEGQKQLICLLAVLVMKPKLLILDEPMSSLDGLATRRIGRKLAELDQKIVMISHDLDLLRNFDRVLWVDEGKIRMDSVPGDVLPAYEADLEQRAERDPEGLQP